MSARRELIRLAIPAWVFALFSVLALTQQTQTPNWKDRQEYDLFLKMSQTSDPKARLDLLNSWQEKYPHSDVATLRLQYYVAALAALAPTNPGERQPLLDKCRELLKLNPKDLNALYEVALWGPVVGGSSPSPQLLNEVEAAARGFLEGADAAFEPARKPGGMSDADFANAKSLRLSMAHNALAWGSIVKRDPATAESEYKTSLKINPEQGATAAQYAKLLYEQKKYPEALFQYARAAQYTGPGPALSPTSRAQLMDFFTKVYREFHGADAGADQVLAAARASAFPPDKFSIQSAADVAAREDDKLKNRLASDPAFALWYTIRENLSADHGNAFFEESLKGRLVPGGANGVRDFSGTVISVAADDKPAKVLVGVDDPTKPDATLEFEKPLSAAVLEKLKPGQKVEFNGVVSGYNKDPYTLVFKDPTIPGTHPARPPQP